MKIISCIFCFLFLNSFSQIEINPANVVPLDSNLALPGKLTEQLLKYKFILIGEMHGTQEPVKFLTQIVKSLSIQKKVVVGYEIPASQLTLAKEKINDSTLRKEKFFRSNSDGRPSQSWFNSIAGVASLKNTDLLFYDITTGQEGKHRDSAMFLTIRNRYLKDTSTVFVLISGNVHNKLIPHQNMKTMGWYLFNYLTSSIISFNHVYNEGTMYNNFGHGLKENHVSDEGGVYKTLSPAANYIYIFRKEDKWGAWNALLYTTKINAAFPIKNK